MTSFNNKPSVRVHGNFTVWKGWTSICDELNKSISSLEKPELTIVIETYQGVLDEELVSALEENLIHDQWINAGAFMKPEEQIQAMIYPYVTDDRIFGYMTDLEIADFFDQEKLYSARQILNVSDGIKVVYGHGASLIPGKYDILIYADMARWEIQLRMRQHLVDNLGVSNKDTEDWMLLYKQGYFVDWRVCDRLKKSLYDKWNYVLDTNIAKNPKMVKADALLAGLEHAVNRPFSVVPFFDPGPWGGQWMKAKCNLDPLTENYAWCFNCVPEENSLLFQYGDEIIETPAINMVFRHPENLLGDHVYRKFGDEFPIRFDFLDTFEGGNLSLQVHPLKAYISEKFGMQYTQDESYYMLDAKENACVYLGLKENIDPEAMIRELETSLQTGAFDADKHVMKWPIKKHDHVLIPAGTVHCSGKDSLVLEISATPYIFTFKLWDWGRLGMDGKPRPININHGKANIQWDRTASWVEQELLNRVEKVAEGPEWTEERTGLHELEFIETRRHWFTGIVTHQTTGSVEVLCLVEGDEAVVESPSQFFDPFVVHYAETWIISAHIDTYTIRPYGKGLGQRCATLKAWIRQ
jgi:mannose-6-phosphate isomerase class I